MALNGDALGQAIADAVLAGQTGLTAGEMAEIAAFWKAVAGQIVSHITSNAVVNVTTTGQTGTGSSGGPLPIVSQPGVGTVS